MHYNTVSRNSRSANDIFPAGPRLQPALEDSSDGLADNHR